MSWISRVWHKTKNALSKVAAPALAVGGTFIGLPPQAGAAVGGVLGNLLESKSSPNITVPAPNMSIATPGFMGNNPVGLNLGETVYRDGRVRLPSGKILQNKDFNGEVFGSPAGVNNGNSSSNVAPLLFGVGALMLLSD